MLRRASWQITSRAIATFAGTAVFLAVGLAACGGSSGNSNPSQHRHKAAKFSSHAPIVAPRANISTTLSNIDLVVSSTLPTIATLVNDGQVSGNLSSCWVPAAGAYIDFTSYSNLAQGVCSGATNAIENRPSGTTIACAARSSTASPGEVLMMVYGSRYQASESVCSAVGGDTAWSITLNFNAAAFKHELTKVAPAMPSGGSQGGSGTSTATGSTSTSGQTTTSTATSPTSPIACGSVAGGPQRWAGYTLTVSAHGASCSFAIHLVKTLDSGTVPLQNDNQGEASAYYLIDGWRCSPGQMGFQSCTRQSGKIDISAQAS